MLTFYNLSKDERWRFIGAKPVTDSWPISPHNLPLCVKVRRAGFVSVSPDQKQSNHQRLSMTLLWWKSTKGRCGTMIALEWLILCRKTTLGIFTLGCDEFWGKKKKEIKKLLLGNKEMLKFTENSIFTLKNYYY